MGIGFFIVGGVIFTAYMGLTIWNIIYSNRKQREENYANYPAFLEKLKAASLENLDVVDSKDLDIIENRFKKQKIS